MGTKLYEHCLTRTNLKESLGDMSLLYRRLGRTYVPFLEIMWMICSRLHHQKFALNFEHRSESNLNAPIA